MEKENIIVCPNCGIEINMNEILYHQLHEQIKKEFEAKIGRKEKELEKRSEAIEDEKKEIH